MPKGTVTLTVGSRIEWIDAVESLTEDVSRSCGFDEGERHDILLAVREAMNNAVVHGNAGDESKRVHLEFELELDGLRVRIRDEGPGFDPDEIPDPTLQENLLKPNGRGVFYIRNLMDEVDLSRASQRGGEIVMLKRRAPATSEQAAARRCDED